MSEEELQTIVQFFKVLADENRLKLIGILANGERNVEELAEMLKLKAPTISHHLAKLKEVNLVQMRSDGNTHYYWLNAETLRDTNKTVLTPQRMATLVSIEGDAWERKVLRDFFVGTRLKEIPASPKKRLVILKWLAHQFEYGEYYKEAQLNEILKKYHEDVAYLRRELISSGASLMQRDKGVYWRVSPELATREGLNAALTEIVDAFKPGSRYDEEQASEMVRQHSTDYPYLIRALVDQNKLYYDGEYYSR